MTTSTPNLSLILYNSTSDQAATFATFRADIAGIATSSNFYKVDTAIGDLDTRVEALEDAQKLIFVDASYISANYYEATVAEITAYNTDMVIVLSLDADSNGTVTLNINSLGTKSLVKVTSTGSTANIAAGELQSSKKYLFYYDGSQWVWMSATSADQVYHSGTSGNIVLVNSDSTISSSGTPLSVVGGAIDASSEKTTPADSDKIGILNSASSYVLSWLSWANLKAAIKTYYDSVTATMTNKTLTTPVISSISNSGTITIPTGTDTLVARDTTDTMTNKRVTPRVSTQTSSATPTINTDNVDAHSITALSTAITSFTTNLSGTPTNFQKLIVRIKDNGTARALAWGASFEARGVALPTTTVINKVLTVGFIYDTVTSKWGCVASAQEA